MKQYNQLKANIVLDFYLDEICKFRNVKKSDVLKKGRKREFTDIRAMSARMAKNQVPTISLNEIAKFFNYREHSTILHCLKKIENLKNSDKTIKATLEYCKGLDFNALILRGNGFYAESFEEYGFRSYQKLIIFQCADDSLVGNIYFIEERQIDGFEERELRLIIKNIDIFDAIIIAKNINSNPLGVLISSLKN